MKELKKWMPMFWGEYFGKTRHLSCVEHGAYLQLIGYYWTKGSLPNDPAQLARICSLDVRTWNRIAPRIKAFFNPDMTHDRIDTELAYAIEKSKTLSANAKLRYSIGKASADTPTPTPTPTKKKGSKIDRGASRLPPDWTPDLQYAIDRLGTEATAKEMENFKDYWYARARFGSYKTGLGRNVATVDQEDTGGQECKT